MVSVRFNVKMTGPPTQAAKPQRAVVGPRRLTCYVSGRRSMTTSKETIRVFQSRVQGIHQCGAVDQSGKYGQAPLKKVSANPRKPHTRDGGEREECVDQNWWSTSVSRQNGKGREGQQPPVGRS
jgi:hypothetical protein